MRLSHSECLVDGGSIADPEFLLNVGTPVFGSVHESASHAFFGFMAIRACSLGATTRNNGHLCRLLGSGQVEVLAQV